MINLKEFRSAQETIRVVNREFAQIGCTLYELRNPDLEYNPDLYFHSVENEVYDTKYYGEFDFDGIEWLDGTQIFIIRFTDKGENIHYVTIPEEWIEQDWKTLEKQRLEKIAKQKEKDASIARLELMKKQEIKERAEYERLKIKFENKEL